MPTNIIGITYGVWKNNGIETCNAYTERNERKAAANIATTLHIAEITVKKALQNIFAKLNIKSRVALTKAITESNSAKSIVIK